MDREGRILKQHIKTIKEYNEWRRGAETEQPNPTTIGEALDEVVKAAERYELVRTLPPCGFKELWDRNVAGEGYFDALVDEIIKARADHRALDKVI